MNVQFELAAAEAAFFVRTIHRPGHHACRVFNRARRWQQAVRCMQRRGFSPYAIAVLLRHPRKAVEKALEFGWRF